MGNGKKFVMNVIVGEGWAWEEVEVKQACFFGWDIRAMGHEWV